MIVLAITGLICLVVANGNSMGETLPNNALGIFVKQSDYAIGDVVLFKVHGCLVAHRIVSETERGFKTKGDNSRSVDPWVVPRDAVKGKLVLVIPFLGFLIKTMRAPIIFAGVTAAIFAFLTYEIFFGSNQPGEKS